MNTNRPTIDLRNDRIRPTIDLRNDRPVGVTVPHVRPAYVTTSGDLVDADTHDALRSALDALFGVLDRDVTPAQRRAIEKAYAVVSKVTPAIDEIVPDPFR